MSTVTRLAGAGRFKVIFFRSDEVCKTLRIRFVDGQALPEGELVARARGGGSDLILPAYESGGSGAVVVDVELLAEDFGQFPDNTIWFLSVLVEDAGSGSGEGDTYILFEGVIHFRVVPPRVIESTRITSCEGSGS